MPGSDDEYVCTLPEKDIVKARKELNEVPSDRVGAVNALRDWIHSQPHLKVHTEFKTLLRVLRGAKFSQVRAREMIEGLASYGSLYPEWFRDVDPLNNLTQKILFEHDYMLILPGHDDEGRKVFVVRPGLMDPDMKGLVFADLVRIYLITGELVFSDERAQVNGIVFVTDLSNTSMKHFTKFPMSEMGKWHKLWQGNQPGRMKAFHHLYPSTIMEVVMAMFKPFLKNKYLQRFFFHDNMESIYRHVPERMWPVEYLPDDYKGDTGGTTAQIIADMKKRVNAPEFVAGFRERTSTKYGIDESKRPKETAPVSHFRKLNVD